MTKKEKQRFVDKLFEQICVCGLAGASEFKCVISDDKEIRGMIQVKIDYLFKQTNRYKISYCEISTDPTIKQPVLTVIYNWLMNYKTFIKVAKENK